MSLILFFLGNSAVVLAADPPCSGTKFNDFVQLFNFLNNNTICTADSQEQHLGGNELWDYKRGADPTDPTSRVGSWEVTANSQVKYTYGDNVYVNDVFIDGNNVCFHNGNTRVIGTRQAGHSGPCPGF
jgi:hypothetical protein